MAEGSQELGDRSFARNRDLNRAARAGIDDRCGSGQIVCAAWLIAFS
jgi:hypothetical protein